LKSYFILATVEDKIKSAKLILEYLNNLIKTYIYKKLMVTDGILPRAYGLTKIHKQGYPLRVIVHR